MSNCSPSRSNHRDTEVDSNDAEALLRNGLPAFSPSALALIHATVTLAREQGVRELRSEHLVAGILLAHPPGRIVGWLNDRGVTIQAVRADLEQRELWSLTPSPIQHTPVSLTKGLQRVKDLLSQFCKGEIVDGTQVLEGGLVATEFIVAAILIEGTSVGCDVLIRSGKGKVTARTLLDEINLDPSRLRLKSASSTLQVTALGGKTVRSGETWVPARGKLPNPKTLPDPPTDWTNWVIPEHLLIGEKPSNTDFAKLVSIGKRTTFVSLMGEFRTLGRFVEQSYPTTYDSEMGPLQILYFPISDFDIPKASELVAVVAELKRRIMNGERMFVHCRGGHGRTGTIVIPLVAALYDVPFQEAHEFVQAARDASPRGQLYEGHLPETREQVELANAVWGMVTKRRR